MKKYWIEVATQWKFLSFKFEVVYNVMQTYQLWKSGPQPSDGKFVTTDRIIKRFNNPIDASNFRDRMNKLEEGNYNDRS